MGAVRHGVLALALGLALLSGPSRAQGGAPWRSYVAEAAARFGLPEDWILRVIAAESGGRTHRGGRPITSPVGAMGLMQVMPATWAALRAQYGLGADPYNPRDNIVAGTAYLRAMYDRFGYPGLFAAYNAGPGRYGEYLARGRPLPRETRDYVAQITGGSVSPSAPQPAVWRAARARSGSLDPGVIPVAVDAIFLAARGPASPAAVFADGKTNQTASEAAGVRTAVQPGSDPIFLLRKTGTDAAE